MTGPRWQHVKELFQAALDQAPFERAAFVREACAGDTALQAEVESLLTAHERAGSFAEPPPTVRLGESFGGYQVIEWLGAGGMGDVYRARDGKLNRDVALKVLPALLEFDRDRDRRFRREAQILASLNHPNIAAIHGVEQDGGRTALVLELVDGPTLADHIARGPVPLDEALHIARQIAEALEAAHEHGIVHRDLKPSNIKVRPDGVVKVLDFGLAKALLGSSADSGDRPRLDGTREGTVLGTAAYMSPEQARGKAVDKRTDIWAFGCVLYEMLTAKPAFAGDDETHTLAAVVRDEPEWSALPQDTPPRVLNLLRRCLTKDPQQRLRDFGDARLVMDGAFDTYARTQPGALASSATRRTRTRFAAYAAVSLLGFFLAGVAIWSRIHTESPQLARFVIQLGAGESFRFRGRHLLAMSPDGRSIAYTANGALYLRPLDQLQPKMIAGTEDRVRNPFFSPDGQHVGFWSSDQLKKVDVPGGTPIVVADVPLPWGVSWENDNTILFGEGPDGIWRVPDTGGAPDVIVKVGAGEAAHGPHLLPGGEWVLFTLLPGDTRSWDQAQIVAQSLRTSERRVLIRGGHDARYVNTGHLVYALKRQLVAVPFDAADLRVTGSATTVLDSVADADGDTTGASHFDVTSSGGLVYVPHLNRRLAHTLVWVERDGREEPINVPVREYLYPRISPDGTRIAISIDVRNQPEDRVRVGPRRRRPVLAGGGRDRAG